MIPGSQALLINVFGPAKRHTALAIWSLTTLVAPIAGPLLGGYISDNYVWPWIFLINVPVGVFCALLCWNNLKSQETPTRKLPIDRVGLLLLVPVGGCAADHARQGQGSRLVQFARHRGPARRHRHCLRRLADLGADRQASHRRLEPVQVAQLLARHGRVVLGLRRVLRQHRADAAVAAELPGLHGHLGRPGLRAERRDCRADLAHDRTLDAPLRPARACRNLFRLLRGLLFHACRPHLRRQLHRIHGAAAGAGLRHGHCSSSPCWP